MDGAVAVATSNLQISADPLAEKIDVSAEVAQTKFAIASLVKEGAEKGWTVNEVFDRIQPVLSEVYERTGLAADGLDVNVGDHHLTIEEIAETGVHLSFSFRSIERLRHEGRLK